jgi:hypothetical protein
VASVEAVEARLDLPGHVAKASAPSSRTLGISHGGAKTAYALLLSPWRRRMSRWWPRCGARDSEHAPRLDGASGWRQIPSAAVTVNIRSTHLRGDAGGLPGSRRGDEGLWPPPRRLRGRRDRLAADLPVRRSFVLKMSVLRSLRKISESSGRGRGGRANGRRHRRAQDQGDPLRYPHRRHHTS